MSVAINDCSDFCETSEPVCSKCGKPLIEEVHRLYFTEVNFHKNCYDFRLTAEERNNCGELLWKE